MAFDIGLGNGRSVRVDEPKRSSFPDNLGGAVEFSLSHTLYKILEVMGNSLGTFAGSILVRFLAIVEPEMIDYVAPLIDQIVSIPELPNWLRDYLNHIKSGEHQVGAALLGAVGSSATGAATGSIVSSLLSPVTYGINRQLHPMRPDPATLLAYKWRGKLPGGTLADYMEDVGYADFMFDNAEEVMRPRLGEGGLIEARRRQAKTDAEVITELKRRGYSTADAELFVNLSDVLLPANDLIVAMHRKLITPGQANKGLGHLGYNPEAVSVILENSKVIPPIVDLVTMAVREAWRDDIAAAWGYDEEFPAEFAAAAAKRGLDPEWALRYWRSHWRLPSLTNAYEMFHRGVIGEGELRSLLKTADYPAGWRGKMIEVAYNPLTRVDVRRMYGLGVLSEEEVYQSYKDIGYNDVNARRMTDFTTLYVNTTEPTPLSEARTITRSVIETAYRKNVITRLEAESRLRDVGYDTDDIELLLSLVDVQKGLGAIPDYMEDYQKDLQKLVLRSYTKRLLSTAQASEYLTTVGLSEPEVGLQLAIADFTYAEARRDKDLSIIGEGYVRRAINRTRAIELLGHLSLPSAQQNQVLGEWEVERQLRTRRLSEAQYRKALKDGIILLDEYEENMRGLGYTETDIYILSRMAVPDEVPKVRQLTESQARKALSEKIITDGEYIAVLRRLGYTQYSIDVLMGVLPRELSEPNARKALKDKVIGVHEYIAILNRLGYSAYAINVLVGVATGGEG